MGGDRPPEGGGGTATVAVALVALLAGLLLAPTIGDLMQPTPLDVWPEVSTAAGNRLVQPEPTELARFLIAFIAPFAIAGLLVFGFAQRGRTARAISLQTAATMAVVAALVLICAGWVTRSESAETSGLAVDYFSNLALVVAGCLSATMVWTALSDRGRTLVGRVLRKPAGETGSRWGTPVGIAILVIGCTVLYATTAAYTSDGLDRALRLTRLHIPFTFEDFAAFGNGATPLTDFASQYSNLLPWVLHPVFSAFDYSPTSFTVVMALLTVVTMIAMWRVLALTVANAWVGVVLYLPVLALGLRPTIEMGDERASNASLYQIMPERYFLPMVVAWLCVRHLRGLRPRSTIGLVFVAGLALLNNVEFGAPALLALVVALLFGSEEPPRPGLRRLGLDLGVGVGSAIVVVSAMTLARSGSLPDVGLLTYFSRLFGSQGFGMQPMPPLGFHLVIYVTFVGALILGAALRSSEPHDRARCGMLGYSGAFGLGASAYYAGRSNAVSLVALFPAWGLCLALLSWASFCWMLELKDRKRLITPVGLLAVVTLVGFGLAVTDLSGVPNPAMQVRRLSGDGAGPTTLDPQEAAARFVEARTEPGTPVLILRENGHLVARSAGVRNVGAINHPLHVISGTQLDDELDALRDAGGATIFTGGTNLLWPSLVAALRSEGWKPLSEDLAANIVEWRMVSADGVPVPAPRDQPSTAASSSALASSAWSISANASEMRSRERTNPTST